MYGHIERLNRYYLLLAFFSDPLAGLLDGLPIIFVYGTINGNRCTNLLADLTTGAEYIHVQNNDDFFALHRVTLKLIDTNNAVLIQDFICHQLIELGGHHSVAVAVHAIRDE